jgi:hypothetical protein
MVINIPVCEIKGSSLMNLLQAFEETLTHMSKQINRLEEGHNSYLLVVTNVKKEITQP